MSEVKKGNCHCGAVEFEVEFENGISEVKRCNCSLCRRKGALMAIVSRDKVKITKGEENLSLYQWNTKIAKHYFCKTCGIYTHHQRRGDPSQLGVNVGCFDDVDPFAFDDFSLVDGKSL